MWDALSFYFEGSVDRLIPGALQVGQFSVGVWDSGRGVSPYFEMGSNRGQEEELLQTCQNTDITILLNCLNTINNTVKLPINEDRLLAEIEDSIALLISFHTNTGFLKTD